MVRHKDVEQKVYRNSINPRNKNQQLYLESIQKNKVTFGIGSAGTGKTHVSIGCAILALLEGKVEKVIITRPVVEAGEKLGFLPGSFENKLLPYLVPCYEELEYFASKESIASLKYDKKIEIVPLAFTRGRNFKDCFIVFDEAQNATEEQIFMLLTRLGSNSTCVIEGDPMQSDLPNSVQGGLAFWSTLLEGVPDVDTVVFSKSDIVREKVVGDIVGRYELYKDSKEKDLEKFLDNLALEEDW